MVKDARGGKKRISRNKKGRGKKEKEGRRVNTSNNEEGVCQNNQSNQKRGAQGNSESPEEEKRNRKWTNHVKSHQKAGGKRKTLQKEKSKYLGGT